MDHYRKAFGPDQTSCMGCAPLACLMSLADSSGSINSIILKSITSLFLPPLSIVRSAYAPFALLFFQSPVESHRLNRLISSYISCQFRTVPVIPLLPRPPAGSFVRNFLNPVNISALTQAKSHVNFMSSIQAIRPFLRRSLGYRLVITSFSMTFLPMSFQPTLASCIPARSSLDASVQSASSH